MHKDVQTINTRIVRLDPNTLKLLDLNARYMRHETFARLVENIRQDGGLTGNTPFYNVTGAISMLVGRFWMIIPTMAIAGSLAAKKSVPASVGTFPTDGGLFIGLVVGVILIMGGLTFFPALALGPIVELLAMTSGTVF